MDIEGHEFLEASVRLKKVNFLEAALLYVAQEISDCVNKEDIDCIRSEVEKGKNVVERLAEKAPSDIREKYLKATLDSFDRFLWNIEVDAREDPDVQWEQSQEHYQEFLLPQFIYLCMAYSDLQGRASNPHPVQNPGALFKAAANPHSNDLTKWDPWVAEVTAHLDHAEEKARSCDILGVIEALLVYAAQSTDPHPYPEADEAFQVFPKVTHRMRTREAETAQRIRDALQRECGCLFASHGNPHPVHNPGALFKAVGNPHQTDAAEKGRREFERIQKRAETLAEKEFYIAFDQKRHELWKAQDGRYEGFVQAMRAYLGRRESLTAIGIWEKARGIQRKLIETEKITVEALESAVLDRMGLEERSILQSLVDFTAREFPDKKLYITIGTQPISNAGPGGFRMTIPDTDADIRDILTYSSAARQSYIEMQEMGASRKKLWAAADFFHELGHTLDKGTEKQIDQFAVKMTRKWLKESQGIEVVKTKSPNLHPVHNPGALFKAL